MPLLRFGDGNLVHQRENAGFDEFDQPFEHLRLAGEVPVERGFRHFQARGQGGCGAAGRMRLLQHLGQCLQNLGLALAGCARHGWDCSRAGLTVKGREERAAIPAGDVGVTTNH
ncbi:hypothetical protein G6F60_014469 [Rhizopus arrhizus]|nr:hypothetical protein G6F60_014469 [Rhizopus arrhizus]